MKTTISGSPSEASLTYTYMLNNAGVYETSSRDDLLFLSFGNQLNFIVIVKGSLSNNNIVFVTDGGWKDHLFFKSNQAVTYSNK